MCFEIYEPDPAKFLSATGLVWQAALKKTILKLNLLTDIGMLLMVKKYWWKSMSFHLSICKS